MLENLSRDTFRYYQIWNRQPLAMQATGAIEIDDAVAVMRNPHIMDDRREAVARNLSKARSTCRTCRQDARPPFRKNSSGLELEPFENDPTPRLSSSSSEPSEMPAMRSTASGLPDHLKGLECMKRARNRATNRFDNVPLQGNSRTLTTPVPAQSMVFLPDDWTFDDYFGGPTIEDCLEDTVLNFPLSLYGLPCAWSCWDDFKDYGYRIQPSFALAFNIQAPILVNEHVLPIAPKLAHSNDRILGGYSLDRNPRHDKGKSPGKIVVQDATTMGIQDLMEEAGLEGSRSSIQAFVKGLCRSGEFIQVDPERDGVKLDPGREVLTTVDIGRHDLGHHRLRFRQALKIFVLPRIGDGPLMTHKEQPRVCRYPPPTIQSRVMRVPVSDGWYTQPFPSARYCIPTLPRCQVVLGSINVYIMFPRMIHRHRWTGRRATIIPYEVQSMWLSDVVLPALVQVTDRSYHPYVDFTLNEWIWKADEGQRDCQTQKPFLFRLQNSSNSRMSCAE